MQLPLADSLRRLSRDKADFVCLLEKEGFDVGLYSPDRVDTQTPHLRDEIYVVASGSGDFVCKGERAPVGPGDAIFVTAGDEHRFENFTADLSAWVIFIGKRA